MLEKQNKKEKRWNKTISSTGVVTFTRIKQSKHKNRKQSRKQKSAYDAYSEWWSEKNLDGSFAYNGVTDDF
jgi:hypothetical protein